jgi:hypothetical protein
MGSRAAAAAFAQQQGNKQGIFRNDLRNQQILPKI